jgi:hypothetical protein
MQTQELIFQGLADSGWFWICLLTCLVAGGLIFTLLKYERQLVSASVGNTLLLLRLAVLGVLFLTFLQPVLTWVLDREKTGRIIVAVDVSESMDTADRFATKAELLRLARGLELIGNATINSRIDGWIDAYERGEEPIWATPGEAPTDTKQQELVRLRQQNVEQLIESVREMSRREIVRRLLSGTATPLTDRLAELGDVELRAFASRSEPLDVQSLDAVLKEPIPGLAPQQTNLSSATEASSGNETSEIMGVVVFTDGRHNTGRDPVEVAARFRTLNAPLIPVMIGSENRPRDISIISIEHPQLAFKDDTPVLKAQFAADGYQNEDLTIVLERSDGTEETRQVRIPDAAIGAPLVDVEFSLDADELGRMEYKLRTAVRDDETRDDNNERNFAVQIVDDQAHVLLLEGEARWEFRFIDNALKRDERVELRPVVFDQPHIGVLPSSFFQRQHRLPTDPAEIEQSPLAQTDMLVIGDVSPGKVTERDWEIIEHYVRETGGTLVLTAGKNSFPFRHRNEVVERLLPVLGLRTIDLTGGSADQSPSERGFRLRLTPDAERESMFQFDVDTIENRNIWNRLPGHTWGLLGEARPGASVLATARRPGEPSLQEERENAAIIHQYYGFGQVLWIGIDSTWRWRHRVGDQYHHRFWGQMARWAARNKASAGNDFVRLQLDRNQVEAGQDAVIQARWQPRFLDLNPDMQAAIEVYREPDDGKGRPFSRIDLTPVEGRPLVHEGRAVSLPSGTWRLKLVAENANLGEEVTTSLYVSEPVTGELSDLSANRDLLTRVADASGGKLLLPDQLGELIEFLKPPEESTESREETTLWDHWFFMTLFFVLLTAEWVVRKLNGLP